MELAFRVIAENRCRPCNFPGPLGPALEHSLSNPQQEVLSEDGRDAPPTEQAGDTLPGDRHVTPSTVDHEDHRPLLTRRSLTLLAGASGAAAIAGVGVASAVGAPLGSMFMIGMFFVAVFSTATGVYKDLNKRR
jgi:hypothetical protein